MEAAGICLKHMAEEPKFEPWNPCQNVSTVARTPRAGEAQKIPGLLGEFQANETLRFCFLRWCFWNDAQGCPLAATYVNVHECICMCVHACT